MTRLRRINIYQICDDDTRDTTDIPHVVELDFPDCRTYVYISGKHGRSVAYDCDMDIDMHGLRHVKGRVSVPDISNVIYNISPVYTEDHASEIAIVITHHHHHESHSFTMTIINTTSPTKST